ncbi:protein DpdE [Blastococcus sp. SYSU DS0617]
MEMRGLAGQDERMIAEVRCPLCGTHMTLRSARRGPNAGSEFWGCVRFPACKGSRSLDGSVPQPPAKRAPKTSTRTSAAETATKAARASGRAGKSPIRRGDLLASSVNHFGPGKAISADGDNLVLEYFDTPEQRTEDRVRMSVPRTGLRRVELKPETRVFWQTGDRWRSGRVIEMTQHRDISVRETGGDWEGFVPEDRLFVRWHRPLLDPVGFGAGGLLESPLLADMRRPFLQAILRQRAAARGMRGALSSAIELHDHQLETAWRILQDPVQRYLLADEVGLGKTIEAGIVLRQLLLDNPELSVQLVLPPFLIGQWRHELEDKFFLKDFPDADVRFARNDEPESWSAADLLIIDEAHNLAGLANSDRPDLAARFVGLAQIASKTPKVLLLSATPALNNEPVFLEMLRLLDPAIYADVSVKQLRGRLAARAGLGRIFLGLQPGLPAVLLRKRLAELGEELPGDADVELLLSAASSALDSGDREALKTRIDGLRMHVAEVYRVHRRMLRTRRTSALEATYQVTGRRAAEPLVIQSDLLTETTRLLEAWRQEALAAHEDDPSTLDDVAWAFAKAVNLAFDPEALGQWAQCRTAATLGEQTALDRMVQDLAFRDRRDGVARPIADALTYHFKAKDKVVVFCATPDLVTDLADELGNLLGSSSVVVHRTSDLPGQIESAIRKFEGARGTAILVADSSAEEGRNFQFADLLVHVGLPADANRLEQRIGRCDRWQIHDASGQWRSLLVTEPDSEGSFTGAWTRILEEGFGVFTSSIASLQFAVEAATHRAWQRLVRDGVMACDSIITEVRASLEAELDRVREQDALDSIESGGQRGAIYRQLQSFESGEAGFGDLTHALLAANSAPGNLRFRVISDPRSGVGGYDALTRLPGKQLQIPLVSVERLERDFLPIRDQRGTFLRRIAVQQPDTHLYRYGDTFIDAVSDFLRHDDRGRAFGMWRWIPDWERGLMIAYRFDYAVEARPTSGERSTAARATLMHRADGLFPPLIVTVWVDQHGHQIADAKLLETLESPYIKPGNGSPGGDFSLSRKRIGAAYKVTPAAEWSQRWRSAEGVAAKSALSLPEVKNAIATGLANARIDSERRVRQLKLRAVRSSVGEGRALEEEAAYEKEAGQTLAVAIEAPRLRLDGTGVVVLSGDELELDDGA